MLDAFFSGWAAMSYWEYIAVALGLAYLLLAMKQSIWCWPAAFVGTSIYTLLFWQGFLYMESLLNFYYLIMAIYGWYQWRSGQGESHQTKSEREIVSWSWQKHSRWIAIAVIVSLVLGVIMDNYTDAKMAYLDTFTTVFSVMTTYMVTQKVLENWLYWVVVDAASIYLYLQQGYLPTAGLFLVYTFLAIQGFVMWRRDSVQNDDKAYA